MRSRVVCSESHAQLPTALSFAHAGLADQQRLTELTETGRQDNMAGLRDAIETDEERLSELEALFGLLDRDGNGRLSADELEAGIAALRPGDWPLSPAAAADKAGDDGEDHDSDDDELEFSDCQALSGGDPLVAVMNPDDGTREMLDPEVRLHAPFSFCMRCAQLTFILSVCSLIAL